MNLSLVHALRRVLLVLSLLALLSAALAQEEEKTCGDTGEGAPSFNIGCYLDADGWLANLQASSDLYTNGISFWANALVVAGCIVSIIVAMLSGSAMGYVDFFSRLMVVVLIYGSVGSLTQINLSLWNTLREWSMAEIGRTFDTNAPELERLGANSAILLTALGAPAMISAAGEASAMVATKAAAKQMGSNISRFLNAAVVPILAFIVIAYLILLLSGMLIIFANVILPISTAMLMFGSDMGSKWLGAYLGSVLTGLFIVAFMPIAFNAAFAFTVVQPVRTLNENFRTAGDVWESYKAGTVPQSLIDIQNEIAVLEATRAERAKNEGFWDSNVLKDIAETGRIIASKTREYDEKARAFFTNTWNGIWTLAEATLVGARNMLLRMALFFLGTLFGLYFIISSSSAIAGLIGGVGLSVAHRLARPLSAAGLGALGAGVGRGGGLTLGPGAGASTIPAPTTAPTPAPAVGGAAGAAGFGGGLASYQSGPSSSGGRSSLGAPGPGYPAQRAGQHVNVTPVGGRAPALGEGRPALGEGRAALGAGQPALGEGARGLGSGPRALGPGEPEKDRA